MSRRLASSSTSSNPSRTDDELLKETRKLLNALNDENAELKEQNNILCDKLRRTSDAVASLTEERDGLERDMKQINFNLMQQLKNKTTIVKELEQRLEAAASSKRAVESEWTKLDSARGESESELMICRERAASLEEANRKLQKKIDETIAASEQGRGQYRELTEEVARCRQALKQKESEHNEEITRWRQDAEVQQQNILRLDSELKATTSTFTKQIAALTMDAQRASLAESESLFAHDQMAAIALQVSDFLTISAQGVRAAQVSVAETDATLTEQLNRVQSLRVVAEQVRQHDDVLIEYLLSERRHRENDVQSLTRDLQSAREELVNVRESSNDSTTLTKRLQSELAAADQKLHALTANVTAVTAREEVLKHHCEELERQVAKDQQSLDAMRKALLEADAALSLSAEANQRLESDRATERAAHAMAMQQQHAEVLRTHELLISERNRHEDDRAALEDEVEYLQQQLREHSESLAHALSRISNASIPRRSMSCRSHRSESTSEPAPMPVVPQANS